MASLLLTAPTSMEKHTVPGTPKARKKYNALAIAISSWLQNLPRDVTGQLGEHGKVHRQLSLHTPKRWVVYEPMVLLPSGTFTDDLWKNLLWRVGEAQRAGLWTLIVGELSASQRRPLTHLAVNEAIPPHQTDSEEDNCLRSPSGLRMLHGDFGTVAVAEPPTEEDFEAAFWVSARQNGICQTWAPRWTMFSRGNIKEKTRLLSFHDESAGLEPDRLGSAHRCRTRSSLGTKWAVDLYAGIGYFVFSYAKLGFRVLCWEINPWSAEGLRRGAQANRWSVKVVQGHQLGLPTTELVKGQEQIVLFLEDNQRAEQRVRELRERNGDFHVVHINCGLLPTSFPTWKSAWNIQGLEGDGWLHLHENVGLADIDHRRQEIQKLFGQWSQEPEEHRVAQVENVYLVKTFAPDVWHCVFDVYVRKSA